VRKKGKLDSVTYPQDNDLDGIVSFRLLFGDGCLIEMSLPIHSFKECAVKIVNDRDALEIDGKRISLADAQAFQMKRYGISCAAHQHRVICW